METSPITRVEQHDLLFNGLLMVEVTKVDDDGSFDFYVLNGKWYGYYSDGKISVNRTGCIFDGPPFEKVSDLSCKDHDQWYVHNRKHDPELDRILAEVDEEDSIPF